MVALTNSTSTRIDLTFSTTLLPQLLLKRFLSFFSAPVHPWPKAKHRLFLYKLPVSDCIALATNRNVDDCTAQK